MQAISYKCHATFQFEALKIQSSSFVLIAERLIILISFVLFITDHIAETKPISYSPDSLNQYWNKYNSKETLWTWTETSLSTKLVNFHARFLSQWHNATVGSINKCYAKHRRTNLSTKALPACQL